MNYNEALDFIHSVSNFFCKPGLSRINKLCEALGNPQKKLRFIHVAGTNGKGSFCAFLTEILKSAGYKVGTYTSPYILDFCERIAINGEPISETDLAEITGEVKNICDTLPDKPTEFEIITAIGFKYFEREKCDIVVLECGLGGRLDATNIIEKPELSVITGIDFDHQAFLGDTIEKIAAEKAGIIKAGVPILWCGDNKAALSVIEKEAKSKNALLKQVAHAAIEIKKSDLNSTVFDFGQLKNLEISLLGSYQPKNAANAVAAAEILKAQGFNINDNDIVSGLKNTVWRARFEKLSDNPVIIFDGSHNPQGVTATVESIKQYFGDKKVVVLSGVMADKDYKFIAKAVREIADTVYCVTAPNPRALSAADYAAVYTGLGTNALAFENVQSAIKSAIYKAEAENLPLIILGSLYMYADIYNFLIKR